MLDVINDVKKYLGIEELDVSFCERAEDGFEISRRGEGFFVEYGKLSELFRALGIIAFHGDEAMGASQRKKTASLGYLVDTARNAVPKVETLKELLIRLAVLGYDRLYFYCEDVMEVKNEPFFGHLRGRYSEKELRQIDDYAFLLGIEVVPCIQTLAHLNCLFKWNEYAQCRDTADILLVDLDRTYRLIDNVLSSVSSCFRSRRIHIGMDEAYLVGRGRHADIYGYEEKHSLLFRHIKRVSELASKYGFCVEMWSDMYFREAFGTYYTASETLPEDIRTAIPENVGLVYWDYWNRDERVIENMLENHIRTGKEITFAGGAWKWTGWNPSVEMALVVGRKMLNACDRHGVNRIILTAWSDDGAEASLFSTLPQMILYSQHAYGQDTDDAAVDDILKRWIGVSLDEYRTLDLSFFEGQREEPYLFGTLPKILLYNDPLSPYYDGVLREYDITSKIEEYAKRLRTVAPSGERERREFEILALLCDVLKIKWNLGIRIRTAYRQGDISSLKNTVDNEIPELISRISEFKDAFRLRWMSENKTNGFGAHDIRLGGLVERLNTTRILLDDYIRGEVDKLEELEEELLSESEESELDMLLWTNWQRIHTLYV